MARFDGRGNNEFRKTTLQRNWLLHPGGSCLIDMGNTRVLCAASVDDTFVPPFRLEHGGGWIDGEYSLLPSATHTRSPREITKMKPSGRTVEISRIIGRAMRTACDPTKIGPRTIWIDCDVLQADGGTRTAAITGATVALYDALAKLVAAGKLPEHPMKQMVAALSVGMIGDDVLLDLCYEEDHVADVDMNFVMTEDGRFIEIQGTAEKVAFPRKTLDRFIASAETGIRDLMKLQRKALGLA